MKRTILAGVAFVCALGAKSFTLEQVMSAPFPSELPRPRAYAASMDFLKRKL